MDPYRILFEDADLVLVSKDAGLPVVPERYDHDRTSLYELMEARWPGIASAHRIDRDTSGLVLWVKHADAARWMGRVWDEGSIEKDYLAIVEGRPGQNSIQCELPLLVDGDKLHRTVVHQKRGAESRTDFTVLERLGRWHLLSCRLHTGKTHQIRAHAAALGMPLAGDTLYGGRPLLLSSFKKGYRPKEGEEKALIDRPALHASRLAFDAPSGQHIDMSDPLPADMELALKMLRKYSK